MKHRLVAAAHLAVFAGIIAGCASAPPSSPPTPTSPSSPLPVPAETTAPEAPREAKPPNNLNLRGFPVAFREGYVAGCESGRNGPRRRDEARYKGDMNYMMGWNDGYSICAPRK